MVQRRIVNLKMFEEVKYYDGTYTVIDIYPFIAYLENVKDKKVICVSVGDLVAAGLEPSFPLTSSMVKSLLSE